MNEDYPPCQALALKTPWKPSRGKPLMKSLEIILGSDCAGKSELRFLHTIDGSLNPRMVRKRISRSDGKQWAPRILQRQLQFARQDFCNVLFFDRSFVKQLLLIAEAQRCWIGNSRWSLQKLFILIPENFETNLRICGRTPTNCISALQNVLTSCGNSSSLYFRRKRPTRVTRASSGAVRGLPAELKNMLRNFRRRKF